MTTSVLWRRDKTPTWGDQALERGLAQWGVQVSPIEAKFLFRGLMYSTVAVPVEPGSDPLSEGTVLRLAQAPEGGWYVPIFTNPQMLHQFSIKNGWTTPDKEVPWSAVQGKEAFQTLSQVDNVECWVNPGSSSLRLDQQALKELSAGSVPDPKRLGAARRVSGVEVQRPQGFQSALTLVQDRVVSALKLTLEQQQPILSAMLYLPPNGPVTLGVKVIDMHAPATIQAVQAVERMLSKATPPISVMILTPEMDQAISKSVPQFFVRKA